MDVAIKLRAEGSKKLATQVASLGKHFKSLSSEINKTNETAGKIKLNISCYLQKVELIQ